MSSPNSPTYPARWPHLRDLVLIKVMDAVALGRVDLVAERHVHVARENSRAHDGGRPDGVPRRPALPRIDLSPARPRLGRPGFKAEEKVRKGRVVEHRRDVPVLVQSDDRVSVDDAPDVGIPRFGDRALVCQRARVIHRRKGVNPRLRGVRPVKHYEAVPVVEIRRLKPGRIAPVQRYGPVHFPGGLPRRWNPVRRYGGAIANNRGDESVRRLLARPENLVPIHQRCRVTATIGGLLTLAPSDGQGLPRLAVDDAPALRVVETVREAELGGVADKGGGRRGGVVQSRIV